MEIYERQKEVFPILYLSFVFVSLVSLLFLWKEGILIRDEKYIEY